MTASTTEPGAAAHREVELQKLDERGAVGHAPLAAAPLWRAIATAACTAAALAARQPFCPVR